MNEESELVAALRAKIVQLNDRIDVLTKEHDQALEEGFKEAYECIEAIKYDKDNMVCNLSRYWLKQKQKK